MAGSGKGRPPAKKPTNKPTNNKPTNRKPATGSRPQGAGQGSAKRTAATGGNAPRSRTAKKKPGKLSPGVAFLRIILIGCVAILTGIVGIVSLIKALYGNLEPRAKIATAVGGFILLAMVSVMLVILVTSRPNAFQINIDDNFVGIVDMRRHSELEAAAVSALVVSFLEEQHGEPVRIFNNISVLPVRSRDTRELPRVVSDVAALSTYRIQMAVIFVDGAEKAALANEAEARRLLDDIRDSFLHDEWEPDMVWHNDFVEDVTVVNEFRDEANLMSFSLARSVLTQRDIVEAVHIVATGETLTAIRNRYNMTEAAILELNPQITNPNMLTRGQTINVLRPRPLLTVRTIVRLVSEEVVPFGPLEFPNEDYPAGHRVTVAPGEDGLRAVTEHLVYENGNLVSRDRIGYEILIEPRPEQIVVGTGG